MPSTGAPDPSARAPCLLCSYGLAAAEPPEPSMPGCRAHSMLTTRASPCARRRALSVMPSLTRVIACTLRSSSESIHAPPGGQRELTYISGVSSCSQRAHARLRVAWPSSRLAVESPGLRVAFRAAASWQAYAKVKSQVPRLASSQSRQVKPQKSIKSCQVKPECDLSL
jgi:hypothetical protein